MPRLRRRDLLAMRLFILAAYTVAAALVAWTGRDSAWWWCCTSPALAGLCGVDCSRLGSRRREATQTRQSSTSGRTGDSRGSGS